MYQILTCINYVIYTIIEIRVLYINIKYNNNNNNKSNNDVYVYIVF
jgi:hypothetical protein